MSSLYRLRSNHHILTIRLSADMLKKKRKADEAFEDYEYVYDIITTGGKIY